MSIGTSDTVGTTGAWHVLSNNINSVPREAGIEIDIRDIDLQRRDKVVKSVLDKVKAVADERGVTFKVDMINQDPPATCGAQVLISNNDYTLQQMPGVCAQVVSAKFLHNFAAH